MLKVNKKSAKLSVDKCNRYQSNAVHYIDSGSVKKYAYFSLSCEKSSAVLSVDKCNRLPRRMQFISSNSDPRKTRAFYLAIMQCVCPSDAVRLPSQCSSLR